MRRAVFLTVLIVAAVGPAVEGRGGGVSHGGGNCSNDWECSLGGVCDGSACACDPWFTGEHCALLNLVPAKTDNGFNLTAAGWSSWGGHAVPAADGADSWVGIFSLMARRCGLGTYHSNSESVVATSSTVDGPYVLADPEHPDAEANLAVAPPSHCTQLKRHPSGEYHLWHIFPGAADNASSPDWQPPIHNCTDAIGVGADGISGPRSRSVGGGGFQQQLFVQTAPTPHGPWSEHSTPIAIVPLAPSVTTATQTSCTAPYYFANGSALIVWGGSACPEHWGGSGGAHGGGGGCLWAGTAANWTGPYAQHGVANGGLAGDPITHPENEDPALFTDPRGNFHMFTNVNTGHRRCRGGVACGGHAWSRDGITWSDTFVGAFGPNGYMEDGTIFNHTYVERPQIAQRGPGEPPLALFVSAGPHYMAAPTFTWAQRFCDATMDPVKDCGYMGGLPFIPPPAPPTKPPTAAPAASTPVAARGGRPSSAPV